MLRLLILSSAILISTQSQAQLFSDKIDVTRDYFQSAASVILKGKDGVEKKANHKALILSKVCVLGPSSYDFNQCYFALSNKKNPTPIYVSSKGSFVKFKPSVGSFILESLGKKIGYVVGYDLDFRKLKKDKNNYVAQLEDGSEFELRDDLSFQINSAAVYFRVSEPLSVDKIDKDYSVMLSDARRVSINDEVVQMPSKKSIKESIIDIETKNGERFKVRNLNPYYSLLVTAGLNGYYGKNGLIGGFTSSINYDSGHLYGSGLAVGYTSNSYSYQDKNRNLNFFTASLQSPRFFISRNFNMRFGVQALMSGSVGGSGPYARAEYRLSIPEINLLNIPSTRSDIWIDYFRADSAAFFERSSLGFCTLIYGDFSACSSLRKTSYRHDDYFSSVSGAVEIGWGW